MTEEQLDQIADLAKDAHTKRLLYEGQAAIRLENLLPGQIGKQAVELQATQAEWRNACSMLNNAKKSAGKHNRQANQRDL